MAGMVPFFVNCLAAFSAWFLSTSQTARISPKRVAFVASPMPMPPHPTRAMPGRSLGPSDLDLGVAALRSRSTNHAGRPVAAAVAPQSRRKDRREMLKGGLGPSPWPSPIGWEREERCLAGLECTDRMSVGVNLPQRRRAGQEWILDWVRLKPSVTQAAAG